MGPQIRGRWDEGRGGGGDVEIKLTFPGGGLEEWSDVLVGDRLEEEQRALICMTWVLGRTGPPGEGG